MQHAATCPLGPGACGAASRRPGEWSPGEVARVRQTPGVEAADAQQEPGQGPGHPPPPHRGNVVTRASDPIPEQVLR